MISIVKMAPKITGENAGNTGTNPMRLAQLCKGFLILQTDDTVRARSFLVSFLKESTRA